MDKSINMFTKDQAQIMQVFASKIAKSFSSREIARILDKDPSQINKAVKPLVNRNLFLTDEKRLRLNYKDYHQELAYIESLRSMKFLAYNKVIKLFVQEVLDVFKDEYLIILLFGSAVEKNKPRDYDFLFIVQNVDRIEPNERFIQNKAQNYTLNFDINVISTESVYEMASNRDEKNVFNEMLNKHLIMYGGESFYRLMKNARR